MNKIDSMEQIVSSIVQSELMMKELRTSKTYMDWLNEFTKVYTSFTDEDWLYTPNLISNEDLNNIKKLPLLFEIIERFANKNYIFPDNCYSTSENCYKIKLNDVGYEIGIMHGQGSFVFCNRINQINSSDFIDFYDIMSDKSIYDISFIESKLEGLSNLIISLHEEGIPLKAIIDTTANAVGKIKKQKRFVKKI